MTGHGGSQLDLGAFETSWSDGEREATLRFEVIYFTAVGPEGIDQGTDRTLLHPCVASDDSSSGRRLDECTDGSQESSGGTSISEVDFLAFCGNRQRTFTTGNNNGFPAVFPVKLCALSDESVMGYESNLVMERTCSSMSAFIMT